MRIEDARFLRRLAVMTLFACGCAQDDQRDGFQPWTPPGGTTPQVGDDGDAADSSGSDDGTDAGSDGGHGSDGVGTDTNAADDAPSDDDGTPPAEGGSDTGTGDPVLDACLEIAVNECETCACNLCLDPLYACEQDPGCVAMRDCAEAAGCVGTECLEPCGAVIDMHGGPLGASAMLALALNDCLEPACPICFS